MSAPWMITHTAQATHDLGLVSMAIRLGCTTLVMIGVLYLAYFLMKRYPLFQQATQHQLARWAEIPPPLQTDQKPRPLDRPALKRASQGLHWLSVAKNWAFRSSSPPTPSVPSNTEDTPVSDFRIAERYTVNPTQELLVVEVGEERFLLSANAQAITLLSPLVDNTRPFVQATPPVPHHNKPTETSNTEASTVPTLPVTVTPKHSTTLWQVAHTPSPSISPQ